MNQVSACTVLCVPELTVPKIHKEFAEIVVRALVRAGLVLDVHAGHDVVQDVTTRLVRHPEALEDVKKFRPWFISCAYRRALDLRKSPWQTRRLTLQNEDEPGIGLPPEGPEVQDSLDTLDFERKLRRWVHSLTDVQAPIVGLHLFAGMPIVEIAKMLGLSKDTALRRYKAGLEALRTLVRVDDDFRDLAAWLDRPEK
ncbi:MAG: RNA polymerase sigma factor [Planctomycetes bacterium]|nr:RNA polymerase sigma factor [Planctomycetota bacterium]